MIFRLFLADLDAIGTGCAGQSERGKVDSKKEPETLAGLRAFGLQESNAARRVPHQTLGESLEQKRLDPITDCC